MSTTPDVPAEVLARLRPVCLGLPEAYEEPAWVGVRWRVRTRTFAHVLVVDAGWPPAYARAAGTGGPATVLMLRSSGAELAALRETGHPFFAPPWRADEVGLVLDARVDWDEVAELVADSYRVMAPRRLGGAVARSAGAAPPPPGAGADAGAGADGDGDGDGGVSRRRAPPRGRGGGP